MAQLPSFRGSKAERPPRSSFLSLVRGPGFSEGDPVRRTSSRCSSEGGGLFLKKLYHVILLTLKIKQACIKSKLINFSWK